jgi:hypothetical protein
LLAPIDSSAGAGLDVKSSGDASVVLENVVVAGAAGEDITAKYELLGAGTYSSTNTHIQDAIFGIDNNTPRELFEARNAVRIAHLAAADKYAASIMAKADEQLR